MTSVADTLRYDAVTAIDDRTMQALERRRRTAVIRRGWLVRRLLLLADIAGLTAAFGIGELISGPGQHLYLGILVFLLTLPMWVVLAKLYSLYDHDEERTDHGTFDDMPGIFHLVTTGAWLSFMGSWAFGLAIHLSKLIIFWLLAILLVTLGRCIARSLARKTVAYVQNTLIIGAGEVGQLVAHKVLKHREYGLNIVGFVDSFPPSERRPEVNHIPVVGAVDDVHALVRLFDIERVIVAFSNSSHEETLALIRSLRDYTVQIDIVPRLFDILGSNIGLHGVEGVPLIGLPPAELPRSTKLVKRAVDVVAALAGLVVLAPFFAFAALLIKRQSAGPVFFRQVRMGSGEQTFRIFKFRTMVADADARKEEVAHLNIYEQTGDTRMFKVADDPRVTRFGAFLRRYSLDELPQLINVLKGDMSLVGPRPLILEEDCHVSDWARRRLTLKPGLTGLWQVLGRNDIPFEEMTKLDYLYVTSWTLWGDLRLVLRTIPAILRPRRAY